MSSKFSFSRCGSNASGSKLPMCIAWLRSRDVRRSSRARGARSVRFTPRRGPVHRPSSQLRQQSERVVICPGSPQAARSWMPSQCSSLSRVPRYTSNYFHTTLSKPSRAEGSLQSFLILFVIISMIDLLVWNHILIIRICNKESLQEERAWKEHAGKGNI